MAVGKILIRNENITGSIKPLLEFLQLVILAGGFTLFGILYVLNCVAYQLQYFGAMHIAFMAIMIPSALLLLYAEFGIQLQRDPLDPKYFIQTWHTGMMSAVRAAAEVYGTLFIALTLTTFIQIYDLVMNGISREFMTLQQYVVYRFVGWTLGLICLVAMAALYTNDTFRNRQQPAVEVLDPSFGRGSRV